MRHVSLLFALLLLIPTFLVPPAGAEGEAPAIAPDHVGRLAPCCGNRNNAYPPMKRLGERAMPDHSLLPPEEKARRKKDIAFHPDLPEGRPVAPTKMQGLRVKQQFEGLNFAQSGEFFPPDTIVAASPGRVLEATNVYLRLTNRDGSKQVRRSLENFFGLPSANSGHFDPRVFFDRLTNRFYVVSLTLDTVRNRSFIFVSVSRNANPANLDAPRNWCNYRINSKIGESWADYPGLGMNENYLAVSVNNFTFDFRAFRKVYIYALDKKKLAQNARSCPKIDFFRFPVGQDANGQLAFTVQPAFHYEENDLAGTPLFFVSSEVTFQVADKYTLWRLRGNGGDKPQLLRTSITGSQNYTYPPQADQKGGPVLDSGDQRMQAVAYRDGRLWAVHTTGCNFGAVPGESCVRVLALDPSNSGGSVAYEDIFGIGDDWFIWMPSVAVNGNGEVAVAFQRSRGDMSAGVGFAGKAAGSTSFSDLGKLINGRCTLENFGSGDRNRTGDYVGIQTDPANDLDFWIAGEYTGNIGGLGCRWRTRVGRVGF